MTGTVPAFRRWMHGGMQLREERFEGEEMFTVIPGRARFARTRNPEPYAAAGFRVCAQEGRIRNDESGCVASSGCDNAARRLPHVAPALSLC